MSCAGPIGCAAHFLLAHDHCASSKAHSGRPMGSKGIEWIKHLRTLSEQWAPDLPISIAVTNVSSYCPASAKPPPVPPLGGLYIRVDALAADQMRPWMRRGVYGISVLRLFKQSFSLVRRHHQNYTWTAWDLAAKRSECLPQWHPTVKLTKRRQPPTARLSPLSPRPCMTNELQAHLHTCAST
ncbi:unnamed protein product [Periconia digitata]|uniref:Uncharacterized protein n=1 Tax=Periconia digitata TaxID=1303443 RepID=A0A9W4UDK9_9PLEO|nr:unnamed protein product [Periconia digitata]